MPHYRVERDHFSDGWVVIRREELPGGQHRRVRVVGYLDRGVAGHIADVLNRYADMEET